MTGLEIELGRESEIERYLEIRAAAFNGQAPSTYTFAETEVLLGRDESVGMRAMIDLGQFLTGKIGGEIIGLAGWRDTNLFNLYVDPKHIRRGFGAKLLEAVETQFVARSSSSHPVLCVDAGLYTRPFYESQGYVVTSVSTSSDGLKYLEMHKEFG